MRDRAAQMSRTMAVVDWARFAWEYWGVVWSAVAAVCMDVSRWYSIICARAGPDLYSTVVLWGIAGTTGAVQQNYYVNDGMYVCDNNRQQ